MKSLLLLSYLSMVHAIRSSTILVRCCVLTYKVHFSPFTSPRSYLPVHLPKATFGMDMNGMTACRIVIDDLDTADGMAPTRRERLHNHLVSGLIVA